MSISRSEILRRKKSGNRSWKVALGKSAHCQKQQEHKVSYRCSLPSPLQKGSKDYKILHRSSARFFDFGKKFLRNLRNFLPSVQENSEAQNFQNLPILGSLLQWWWQWASIGHFVFLFLPKLNFLQSYIHEYMC